MSEHSDSRRHVGPLDAEVRRLGAEFLLTELHTGLALLDTINASADRHADQRRHALALEAYEVVTERLARTGEHAAVLADSERSEITTLLEELRSRLGSEPKA